MLNLTDLASVPSDPLALFTDRWRSGGNRSPGASAADWISKARTHANRGRSEVEYLCDGLYVVYGRSDRQFSIVIRIGGVPYAGSERHRFALRHLRRPG